MKRLYIQLLAIVKLLNYDGCVLTIVAFSRQTSSANYSPLSKALVWKDSHSTVLLNQPGIAAGPGYTMTSRQTRSFAMFVQRQTKKGSCKQA